MSGPSFQELINAGALRVSDGYRAKNNELGGKGPVFLRGAYLQDSGFDISAPDRFSHVPKSGFGDKIAMTGDTVITTKGNSTGRVGYVNSNVEGSVYSPHLSYWRSLDHDRISPRYLYYWSKSHEFRSQLFGLAFQTDMAPYLSLRDQMFLKISLPHIDEQREIAAILGTLDDKIELNRKTAATLEEMARALYRSWFVDFDPVWAKLEGRAPAHMDAATAALFPDRFDEEGLPEGWSTAPIYDFAKVQYGAPFASKLFNAMKKGRPLVRIRDLKNHTAGVFTTEVHKKEYLIQPGDIVVGMDGDFTAYSWSNEPALMNQRVCCFVPVEERDRAFVRYGLPALLRAEEEAAVATTVIHLGKKDIDRFELVDPGIDVLERFSALCGPLLQRTVRSGLENQTLANLRDTLLPRLMTGELRVGEAREQVEDVA